MNSSGRSGDRRTQVSPEALFQPAAHLRDDISAVLRVLMTVLSSSSLQCEFLRS